MNDKPTNVDNHVIAVIDTEEAAQATAKDLEVKGFNQTSLFRGEEVADKIDPKGDRSGPIAKLFKIAHDHLSEEPNFLKQYEEEARSGHDVVAIAVKNKDAADAVESILERHGARNVRFFGRLAVTDLTPESNPTRQSAESPEVRARETPQP